jgi:Domain of unknown function (DUF4440)
MKSLSVFILTIFSFYFPQQKINAQSTRPTEQIRQELLQKIQDFTEAWAKSDTVFLSRLLANEYKHTDIWGKILHRQEWLTYAITPRIISDIVSNEVEILQYSDNLAIITGKMSYKFGVDKQTQEIRFTQIWSKNAGQWKRITFQATLIDKSK